MKSKHLQLDKAKIPPKRSKKGTGSLCWRQFENKHKRGRSLVDIIQVFLWNLKILLLLFLSTSQSLKSAQSQQRQSHSPGVTGRTANLAKQKRFHVEETLESGYTPLTYYNITYYTILHLWNWNLSSQQHLKEIWDSSVSSTIPPKSHIKENIVAGTRILQKRGCLWNRTHMHTCTANIWSPSTRN